MMRAISQEAETCGGCDVVEGQLHSFGCPVESCPFCFGPLGSCACKYEHLGLFDAKLAATGWIPKAIYEGGLSDVLVARWENILALKGRRRFAPVRPASPWRGLGTMPAAALVTYVKWLMSTGGFKAVVPGSPCMTASLADVGNHGRLVARTFKAYSGRNPRTGAPAAVPAKVLVSFEEIPDEHKLARSRPHVPASLATTTEACRTALDRGDARIELPTVGVIERGFSWVGMQKRPTLRFERFQTLSSLLARVTVPRSMR